MVSTIGFNVSPTVIVRQGVAPGNANAGATVPTDVQDKLIKDFEAKQTEE